MAFAAALWCVIALYASQQRCPDQNSNPKCNSQSKEGCFLDLGGDASERRVAIISAEIACAIPEVRGFVARRAFAPPKALKHLTKYRRNRIAYLFACRRSSDKAAPSSYSADFSSSCSTAPR
jgi:hypothetical protein